MAECACCGVELPAEAKVRLCPACFLATSAQGMYLYCTIHSRQIKSTENTE